MRSLREGSLDMLICVCVCFESVARMSKAKSEDAAPGFRFAHPGYDAGGLTTATSVYVLQVAPVTIEIAHRLLGGLGRQPLHVRDGTHERRAHVLRHRLGVAADIEVGAVVEPFNQV